MSGRSTEAERTARIVCVWKCELYVLLWICCRDTCHVLTVHLDIQRHIVGPGDVR